MNIKSAQPQKITSFIRGKHIHFIGIGGVGISALARMLLHRGLSISGMNDSESPETLDELREKGVHISVSTDSKDLP